MRITSEKISTDKTGIQKKIDEKYMRQAIRQEKKAYELDHTPIDCGIDSEGKILRRGYNR